MKALRIRPLLILSLTGAATLLSGCDKVPKGIEAYYQRRYEAAKAILAPVAREAAKKDPKFSVTVKDGADLTAKIETAIYNETYVYFAAWQAYTGSLAALGERDSACTQLDLALRPIEFKIKVRRGPDQKFTRDPRDAAFDWSAEVGAMQGLAQDLECPAAASELPPALLL